MRLVDEGAAFPSESIIATASHLKGYDTIIKKKKRDGNRKKGNVFPSSNSPSIDCSGKWNSVSLQPYEELKDSNHGNNVPRRAEQTWFFP